MSEPRQRNICALPGCSNFARPRKKFCGSQHAMVAQRSYTPEQEEKLVAAYKTGCSIKSAADDAGMSVGAASDALRRRGLIMVAPPSKRDTRHQPRMLPRKADDEPLRPLGPPVPADATAKQIIAYCEASKWERIHLFEPYVRVAGEMELDRRQQRVA